MSYTKYTTDAFVIASKDTGEADKIFKLYTKDFGMVFGIAKSVRLLKSKLKNHLSAGNRIKVSLVRAKDFWRIVEAERMSKGEQEFSLRVMPDGSHRKFLFSFSRILAVLSRLVHGEEQNETVFNVLVEAQKALEESAPEHYEAIEIMASSKIIAALGYGSNEALFEKIIASNFGEEEAIGVIKEKRQIISIINKTLAHTQL